MNAITRRERLVFVVRIDVAVLPHAVVGAAGGFLGVEHVVEERFGESARRGADVDALAACAAAPRPSRAPVPPICPPNGRARMTAAPKRAYCLGKRFRAC